MKNRGFQSAWKMIVEVFFWMVFGAMFAFPLLWALSVSFQPDSIRYHFLPQTLNFKAYSTWIEGGESFLNSFPISLVAALAALVVSLASAYVVHARVVLPIWRNRIAIAAISLFFLPGFAIYPAIALLSRDLPFFRVMWIQFIIIHTVQAFPIAFVLLLSLFASLPRSHFEQLVLETGSRVKAFWYGIVKRNWLSILAVLALTFATVWCEFYITGFITTLESIKPFSVQLQMYLEEYTTRYSPLAAGAIMSLVVSLGPMIIGLMIFYAVKKIRAVNWIRKVFAWQITR